MTKKNVNTVCFTFILLGLHLCLPQSVQVKHLDTKHPKQLEEIPVSVSIFL